MGLKLAGLCVTLIACTPAAPVAPAPPKASTTAEPIAAQAPPRGNTILVPDGPYRLSWAVKDDTRSGNLNVAPWGDAVVVQNNGTVLVLAGHDGSELSRMEGVCKWPRNAAFVDYNTLMMVCDDEVVELRFPDGATRRRAAPYGGAQAAAITATAFATRDWDDIRVYRRATFDVLFDKKLEHSSEMQLSPDGERLAVLSRRQGVTVFDVHSGKVQFTLDHYARSMTFSPDGSELALGTSSSLVVVDASSGHVLREVPDLASLDALVYFTPDLIGGIDHFGVTLVPRTAKSQRVPLKKDVKLSGQLVVSPDATLACAAGSWGEMGCFSTRAPKPSGYPAVASKPVIAAKSDGMTAQICAASALCVASGACAVSEAGRCVVSSGSACERTAQCRWLGRCEAEDGVCVASAKSCGAAEACQVNGVCMFHEGACVAGDAACRRTEACRERGVCTSDAGRCVIGSEQDCYQSLACASQATCSFADGACVVRKDEDCRMSELCQSKSLWGGGRCTAREESCVRASDYGCRRTRNCRESGECFINAEERCVAKKAEDCRKSTDCQTKGLCSFVELDSSKPFGTCAVVEPSSCATTAACTEEGRCLPALGQCVKSCTDPVACRVYGLCQERGGRCVGTAATCKTSVVCKRQQLCRLSPEGICVR